MGGGPGGLMMWDRVVGQDQAVTMLRRAATRPVHAYLLAGPAGSGVAEAARCFAAALVCPHAGPGAPPETAAGCGVCSTCRRVLRGTHPDVVEIEPAGTFIVVDQIEDVVREAFTSPFEAARKVIVIAEADRMNETAANKVLKTLEEPGDRTHLVLLTDSPDDLLPTVRSRAQPIDFAALSEATVRDTLLSEGIAADLAAEVARRSSGRLDRARALAGVWAPLRAVALEVAAAVDGTGAAVALGTGRLEEAAGAALAAMEAQHKADQKALEADLAETAYPDRLARRLRKDLEQRQQRALRRARSDVMAELVTALETYYRDALVQPALPAEAALEAIDACRDTLAVVVARTAVNDTLLLEHLLLRLPPAATLSATPE
ncbi:MAG: ATP-binding protein [Acidimicrobiia bacterium]